ncbi:hypothetical protein ACFFU1_13440 [Algibacter miyuki]|uniref:PH domain-containing protein n=1 Tax=Algibacter miyuki TaxID=1306933 RepID=A0ABV5H3M7_9FLAO|nr:hypothetical protein [Algibacter miyuki]MDN3666517.1 hypothetical protein [Algibacter miyuki]
MRVFKEEQRFTQLYIIVLITMPAIIGIIITTNKFIEQGSTNLSEYLITLAIIVASSALIFLFKLKTRIDEVGIHYQFFPFHFKMKTINWHDIKHVETRTYDALSEYGGWGLKGGVFWKKSNGTAVNVSGDLGIQITLKNNKRLLIGTLKKNDANAVIARYFNTKQYG